MAEKHAKHGKKKARKSRHPWRENVEALTMAVIWALVLKCFVIEVSKIPSGSMQPTLMGSPETGVMDRVIVDKLSYSWRDPARYEIVVFRHPLERSRNMVKRVWGMPDEWLRIAYGDVWTRPDESAPWTILRRPPAVQDAMWRELAPRSARLSDWKAEEGSSWTVLGDSIAASGPGTAVFRPAENAVTNEYLDGYPDPMTEILRLALRGRILPHAGQNVVGDLRLDAEVSALEGCESVVLEVGEDGRSYRFELPGPAAPADARPRIVRAGNALASNALASNALASNALASNADGVPGAVSADEPWRLEAGDAVDVRVQNLDDRLELYVDGEWILGLDVPAAVSPTTTRLAVHVEGAGAEIDDLRVLRDVYYVENPGSVTELYVPPGHYFMLGDNTQDSADGREWKAVELEWPDPASAAVGNYREQGENPSEPVLAGGRRLTFFRDQWGERHEIPSDVARMSPPRSFPLVPRSLVQGRAVAVFWPIKPVMGVWRVGWIH